MYSPMTVYVFAIISTFFTLSYRVGFVNPQCFGKGGQICCNGFTWDAKEEICKPCRIGYFGYKCTLKCRYPNFGEQCQGVCTCVMSSCNPINGCDNNDISVEYKTSAEIQKSTPNMMSFTQIVINQNMNPVPNVYVVTSIAILGAAIIIFPMVILLYRMMKFRMRLIQYGQRNGNDENIVTYQKNKSNSREFFHDSPERPGSENTFDVSHGYEEIASRQSQQSQSESEINPASNESWKADEDYLSPI